jgi:hypothetical protein
MARDDVLVERNGPVTTICVSGSGRHGNGVGRLATG